MDINDSNIHDYVKFYIKDKSKLPDILQNVPIGDWNVSNVTNMHALFDNYRNFNEPLENWNVSNVKDMGAMFFSCNNFNQSLNKWNVSKVKNMSNLFYGCYKFNQPLDKWDVSNVTNMRLMFSHCYKFNQPLNNWNVSNVKDMNAMFEECESFNQSLDNWNVSNDTETEGMFEETSMTQLPDWYNRVNEEENREQENNDGVLPWWQEYVDEQKIVSAMKIQSRRIPSKEMNIVLPEEIFDVINQENINVKDFLGDSNNILFMFNNQFYPLSKYAIKTQLNPSTTFYGCNKATG